MSKAHLFQLGMDLEAGTTHAEGPGKPRLTVVESLLDEDRDDHFIHRDGKVYAGTHLIVEVVDGTGLDDEGRIQQAMRDCVEACGATLLHIHTHRFSPQGVSGVAVLSESHISVHTWPEIGYGAFDVFMCGDAEPWKSVEVLRRAFNAGDVQVKELLRGDGVVAARL
ncbi:MAG: adenosylmethionine decarboxylase [Pseudomonadota bacterium]